MSYQTISVKEAVGHINAQEDCWVLPAVQRPYVWGSRYESEKYICKLFDSIAQGYPIGTMIVWKTKNRVAYHEFITDYCDGMLSKQVSPDMWDRTDKWLVYDGQQRMQTLFSCLRYTINGRKLIYDILYDQKEEDNYGFKFVDKDESLQRGQLAMNILFSQKNDPKSKIEFKSFIEKSIKDITNEEKILFEERFDILWSYFVQTDKKSIAYFPVDGDYFDEEKVNDIFQRINTGGVPLTGADLLFTEIKKKYIDFEERLYNISQKIKVTTGYDFSQNEILQLINLIVKRQTRIDASKIKENEISQFNDVSNKIEKVLNDFFISFLFNEFQINNSSLISKKLALLPLIVFIYRKSDKGIKFADFTSSDIINMKKYLIVSQVNDWNTQGIVENVADYINKNDTFPYNEIVDFVQSKNRLTDITIDSLENNKWFILKVLTPDRPYVLDHRASEGRYRPELDHIFPLKLKPEPDNYDVDIIWNLQPVSGKTNMLKSNTHPKEFFSNLDTSHHINEYNFVPDINSDDWDNHISFIKNRKEKMIAYLKDKYNIEAR